MYGSFLLIEHASCCQHAVEATNIWWRLGFLFQGFATWSYGVAKGITLAMHKTRLCRSAEMKKRWMAWALFHSILRLVRCSSFCLFFFCLAFLLEKKREPTMGELNVQLLFLVVSL